jgi:diguanylate cyclase (GGDEF)-like protein/PAS domain S-box-containing protein
MSFINMSDYNNAARAYWWVTTLVGALAFGWALNELLSMGQAELLKLAVAIVVVFFAGLRPIRLPGTQVSVSPCDLFVFLAALYGGAASAILVAVFDAFIMSFRTSKRWTSRLGGPALMAISIFISAKVFEWALLSLPRFLASKSLALLLALLLFSLAYFILNTSLLTLLQALKKRVSPLALWWQNYSWTGITFAASASAAGLIYLASKEYGIVPFLAAAPIVATIFATCHFYFKQSDERNKATLQRIEAAEAQAGQAKLHAQEMAESEERFRSAFDYAAIGMALVSADGKWLQVNRALCNIIGYSEEALLATDFQSLTHPDDVNMVSRHIAKLLSDKVSSSPMEKRYVHQLGHTIWVLLSASLVRDSKSNSLRLIFQIQDITDRKRAEEKLAHDAFHDGLTDLPNRALFMDHLKLAMARVERHREQMYALLFLDVDRFKVINDSLGHMVGDQLLIAIAKRLEKRLRPFDTIARLGGDEFTILLEDIKSSEEAIELTERIQKGLTKPFQIGNHEIFTSASIGIALSNPNYKKTEEVLRDADTAMYSAKSLGKARYALFDQSMHDRALQTLQLETDLRHAVEREEFFVVYQPIVSLETARLIGFEVLVRWQHPLRGIVSPADFIPSAEETGYIIPIGQWVLEQSCRQLRLWQDSLAHEMPLTLSVNLSGKQFAQNKLISQIMQTVARTGIDPHHLKLEITESVVVENIETATEMLNQLRAIGIQLSIDDFGTGYSSLSYLHRLPIDTLKIDRSFVYQMMENNENSEIVRTIVSLAKNLGMSLIAEGVETIEQLEQLKQLGCDNGQGYLFSKPLAAEAATQLVKQMDQWQAFAISTGSVFNKAFFDLSTNKYTIN